jgi:hypothetical protein
VSVNAVPVEAMVEAYAGRRLSDPRVLADLADIESGEPSAQGEIVELQLRIRELEQQLDRPGVPVATILAAVDRAKARQEELLGKVVTASRAPAPPAGAEWPEDLYRRRALVELVVARVVVARSTGGNRFDPGRVEVVPVGRR